MTFIRRWKTTISAGFESITGKLENHEAIAKATLDEARQAAARARVKAAHVEAERQKANQAEEAARSNAANWRQRALRERDSDRETALECLQRAKHAEAEAAQIGMIRREIEATQRTLNERLASMDTRIRELTLRKDAFAVRANRAAALNSIECLKTMDSSDGIFERWELKLAGDEALVEAVWETAPGNDSFAAQYEKTEERAALEAELEALEQTDSKGV